MFLCIPKGHSDFLFNFSTLLDTFVVCITFKRSSTYCVDNFVLNVNVMSTAADVKCGRILSLIKHLRSWEKTSLKCNVTQ
jgi:hypothetical protein